MPKLIWNEAFSVGVKKLDNQHKQIFNLINVLIDLKNIDASSEEIDEALTSMTEYVTKHFDTEEKYLSSIGYHDLQQHEIEHLEFAEKTAEFCLDVMAGKEESSEKINAYLRHWWVEHILKNDMAYKKFAEGSR